MSQFTDFVKAKIKGLERSKKKIVAFINRRRQKERTGRPDEGDELFARSSRAFRYGPWACSPGYEQGRFGVILLRLNRIHTVFFDWPCNFKQYVFRYLPWDFTMVLTVSLLFWFFSLSQFIMSIAFKLSTIATFLFATDFKKQMKMKVYSGNIEVSLCLCGFYDIFDMYGWDFVAWQDSWPWTG